MNDNSRGPVVPEGEDVRRLGRQTIPVIEHAENLVGEPACPAESETAGLESKAAWVLPEDFISRCTSVVLLLSLYSALCMLSPTVLGIRANPAVMPAGVKPAWDFLFLYEFALRVPSFVGALTPVLLLALLGALPFLDRNPSRDPRKRVLALLLGATAVIAILALTVMGWVR